MIKILLADDHAIVRKGLQLMIGYEDNLALIGEACNGEELLELIESEDADILLLDLDMPKMNGLTAIPKIRALRPNLRVIILSMHPEDLYGQTAFQMGADAYICKDEEPKKLINTIDLVYVGEKVFSEKILLNKRKREAIKLSKRELEVYKLLVNGMANKDIADELDLSDKTVSTYKTRLFSKIGARSMVDLINFADHYKDILSDN